MKYKFYLPKTIYNILDRLHIMFHERFGWVAYTNELFRYHKYSIGDHTYWYPDIVNYGTDSTVKIGKFCSIAPNVQMLIASNHRIDWISTYPFLFLDKSKKIEYILSKWDIAIGNDVRIGKNVIIMDGVTIWDGAVIAAWAVVTKNIDPYAVVWGVPAKIIKHRFSEDVICLLLSIKRWDRSEEKIIKHIPILCSGDIQALEKII